MNDLLRNIWFKPGNSNLSADVDWLFMYILWVCIISFVLLMGAMAYFVIRYRRRPGHVQQRTPNHNTALEVTWIVVPLILVTFIFFWGFQGYMSGQVAVGTAERLNVSAKKWAWGVTYANGAQSGESIYFDNVVLDKGVVQHGNSKMPVFIVPEGQPVIFTMSSVDVIHSFYIPDMRIKMDVFPNRLTSLTFTPLSAEGPDQAGVLYDDPIKQKAAATGMGRDHYIFCAEYCGSNHSEMSGILRVLPKDEYQKTLQEWADVDDTFGPDGVSKKGEARLPLWQLGQYVHSNKGCSQCHSVDGSKGSGPSWKGYYGTEIEFADGKKLTTSTYNGTPDIEAAWAQYIRESIIYPAVKLHAGFANQMPSYADQLSEKQIMGVVAYMRHIAGKVDSIVPDKAPASTPAAGAPTAGTPAAAAATPAAPSPAPK